MKKISAILSIICLCTATAFAPIQRVSAALSQTPITRSQVENRALSMINLKWIYSKDRNGTLNNSSYVSEVTQPAQLANITQGDEVGIPYNWGGLDGIDSNSYYGSWTSFLDAVNKGAFVGNVNTDAGLGLIPGTAGIDCSGFVQASFNIKDYKQSTSSLLNNYFTRIDIKDIKHMDILDKPGDHVSIFDKWGYNNGIYGAFTYESTTDQTRGGIQGTKQYFLSMNEINTGYIAARYNYIIDDIQNPAPAPAPSNLAVGSFGQVTNVNYSANLRANPSTSAALIGTISKGTVVKIMDYSNGWYKIYYNNSLAWIYGNLLGTVQNGKYVTIKDAYQLNIRSLPSSTGSILGILTENQCAAVLGTSGDWVNISTNGINGWCYTKYINYIN
ncbi:MAG: hypothetical protein K0R54_979 [Clostridiaceae bacterium]|jgi:uncharacterized protein YraI|nr:hypothetical protein [Clostridiaceae bacterium]